MARLYNCSSCGHVIAEEAPKCVGCGTVGPLARRQKSPAISVESSLGDAAAGQALPRNIGAEAPRPKAKPASVGTTRDDAVQWRCPICRNEHIRKVSVIYQESIRSARGLSPLIERAHGAIGDTVVARLLDFLGSSSELGERLSPPKPPLTVLPAPPKGSLRVVSAILAVIAWPFGFVIWMLLAGLLASIVHPGLQPDEAVGFRVTLAVIGATVSSWGVWHICNRYTDKIEKEAQATYARQLLAYNAEQAEYNRKLAEWERLFLCDRCGSTFDLNVPRSAQATT